MRKFQIYSLSPSFMWTSVYAVCVYMYGDYMDTDVSLRCLLQWLYILFRNIQFLTETDIYKFV